MPDINEQKLEEIKSLNPKIEIAKLDSTNKEEVENFYAKIDIDVLFHAVGFVHHGALLDCDTDEFHNSININIFLAIYDTHVLPKMLKKKKAILLLYPLLHQVLKEFLTVLFTQQPKLP